MSDEPTLVDVVQQIDALAEVVAALTSRLEAGPQKFLTIEGAAHYSDLSTKSIRRLVSAGDLVAHRPVRGRLLISRDQLDAFIVSSAGTSLRKGRGMRARRPRK